MARLRIELNTAKCQAFAKCKAIAPAVFALGEDRKVRVIDAAAAPQELLVKAARGCPYGVISVFDDENGQPVFPPPRRF